MSHRHGASNRNKRAKRLADSQLDRRIAEEVRPVVVRHVQPSDSVAGGAAAGRQDCPEPPAHYRTVSRDELRQVRESKGR